MDADVISILFFVIIVTITGWGLILQQTIIKSTDRIIKAIEQLRKDPP